MPRFRRGAQTAPGVSRGGRYDWLRTCRLANDAGEFRGVCDRLRDHEHVRRNGPDLGADRLRSSKLITRAKGGRRAAFFVSGPGAPHPFALREIVSLSSSRSGCRVWNAFGRELPQRHFLRQIRHLGDPDTHSSHGLNATKWPTARGRLLAYFITP